MILQKIYIYLNKETGSIIFSYRALRRLIGITGIIFPYICIAGAFFITKEPVMSSISDYYYTNMRDLFTGQIFIISVFLITYKGYQNIDNFLTFITGITGLGVAVFPCLCIIHLLPKVGIFQLSQKISNIYHLSCAGTFIFLLAINSLFLFTKSAKNESTKEKKIRNIIYILCGIIILLSLVFIAYLVIFSPEEFLFRNKTILILETIALNAFGISWLIKGETLFRDKIAA